MAQSTSGTVKRTVHGKPSSSRTSRAPMSAGDAGAGSLYPYQLQAVDKLISLDGRGCLFLDMGTGKTRVALEIARRLACRRILVVAPLSATGVWKSEPAIVWPELKVVSATWGSIKKRAAVILEGKANLLIVGYESYWREPLRTALVSWKPDMIIYDEAHRLKGRATKQSRFGHRMAGIARYRLALTGTPMPNGPEDLFGIYRAIDPDVFGTRWMDFEYRYIKKGGYLNYQIVGYRRVPELKRKLAATASRVTKAQALDLPAQVDVSVPFQLDKASNDVYEELRKKAMAKVTGLHGVSGLVLARMILTNVLRLQTVTGGWVKLEDGQIADLSYEKERVLLDLLDDVMAKPQRVVIFCRFTHDIDRLANALIQRGPTLILDGRVPPKDRDALLDSFRSEKSAYLIAQVAVASLGIDLSCSYTGIFYSLDWRLDNYLQSRDRLHRHGQEFKVTYYHLLAEGTVDEKIYTALRAKENLANSVLDVGKATALFSRR